VWTLHAEVRAPHLPILRRILPALLYLAAVIAGVAQTADTVLLGGKILTVDEKGSMAEAGRSG